jgi:hypothetical protein
LNHKLRVLVRVDLDPGHVTLEVSGCLTPTNFPVLLHLLLRAQKLATCATITVDFRDASHLDESVLSYLQQVALPADHAFGEHVEVHHELGVAAASALEDADDFQLTLLEPSELPVCPIHGGESDHYGEADAESALAAMPLAGIISPQSLPGGKLAGLVEAGERPMNNEDLARFLAESGDSAETVAALPEPALEDLADALYRHLDTPSPAFGAHSWYVRVADELRMRRLTGIADAPAASDGLGPGEPAGREVPAG